MRYFVTTRYYAMLCVLCKPRMKIDHVSLKESCKQYIAIIRFFRLKKNTLQSDQFELLQIVWVQDSTDGGSEVAKAKWPTAQIWIA